MTKSSSGKNPGSAGKEKIYNLPAGISRNHQDPIGETDGRTIWQCVDHKSYYGCPGYKRCNSIPPFAFIGDSLTAGYGVDGINGISTFRTADEDVTKTYAYQAAEMLHADSRIVAYSGNGVLSAGLPRSRIHLIRKTFFPKFFPIYKTKFRI